jgi:hypothetical protein
MKNKKEIKKLIEKLIESLLYYKLREIDYNFSKSEKDSLFSSNLPYFIKRLVHIHILIKILRGKNYENVKSI